MLMLQLPALTLRLRFLISIQEEEPSEATSVFHPALESNMSAHVSLSEEQRHLAVLSCCYPYYCWATACSVFWINYWATAEMLSLPFTMSLSDEKAEGTAEGPPGQTGARGFGTR
jgi:hypothetical protein